MIVEIGTRAARWLLITLTVIAVIVTWGFPGPPPLVLRIVLGTASLAVYLLLSLKVNRDALLEYGFAVLVWSVAIRTGLSMIWIMTGHTG